jgi:DNA-binding NtrC family response regulator
MQPIHALLVTDNPKEISILRKALGPGTILTGAHDLAELNVLVRGGSFELVLCDWSFANGSWKDALQVVQDSDPHLPVVILSDAQKKEWLEVLEAGASDLLSQPPQPARLTAILEHTVRARHARRVRAGKEQARRIA